MDLAIPGTPSDILDASGDIATDVACRRCGYNLRGLRLDGRCPECGTPIGLSTSGDFLRFPDPAWVEKLALGIHIILWGIAVSIAASVLAAILGAVRQPVVSAAIQFAGQLVAFYGAWLLTEPDPSGLGEERYANARKVIRFALLIGLISNVLAMPLQGGAVSGPPAVALTVVMVLTGIVALVGEYAKLTYLAALADRIPSDDCAKRARFLRTTYVVCLAIMLVVSGLILVVALSNASASAPAPVNWGRITSAPPGASPAAPAPVIMPASPRGAEEFLVAGGCVIGLAGLGLLVFTIFYLLLLIRMGRSFRQQAVLARETWAATEPRVES